MKNVNVIPSTSRTNNEIEDEVFMTNSKFRYKLRKIIRVLKQNKLLIVLLKEFILFLLIIISIIYYKKSLKIPEVEEKDMEMAPEFFMQLFYDCFKAAAFATIALSLIQFKICKKYLLFFFLASYLTFFIVYRGISLESHGTYNMIVFIFFMIFGQIFILIIFLFKWIFKWKKWVAIGIITTIIISSVIVYKLKVEDKIKCKGWEFGLNNTKLDNDKSKYPCSIIIPNKRCNLNYLGPNFDFSKGKMCSQRKEEEKINLLKKANSSYVNANTKRIGFPITTHKENFKLMVQLESVNLYHEIMNNLIDMDNKEVLEKLGAKEKPEVVLDYTKNEYGEVNINVNFDQELSTERKNLEKDSNPLYDNIIFIFLDGISRNHFARVYKKTAEFIKKFMPYEGINNNKESSQKYHGFEFFKQHSFREFTLGNFIPMFYGHPFYWQKIESIIGEFKDKGFVTGSSNSICDKEGFYYNWHLKEGMERTFIEFDHEMFGINCDPNIFDIKNPFNLLKGESSIFRRCLYGKENVEYSFEYGRKFLEAYINNRKFLRICITDGHELTGQVSKYVDEPLVNFLNYIYDNNYLKNTALILASDHGLNILVLYKLLQSMDQDIEMENPLLFFILSDKEGKSYEEQYENLQINQQKFITTYDVYHTLKYILNQKDEPITIKGIESKGEIFDPKVHFLGTSLFHHIDPSERLCSNYIDIHKCICKPN